MHVALFDWRLSDVEADLSRDVYDIDAGTLSIIKDPTDAPIGLWKAPGRKFR